MFYDIWHVIWHVWLMSYLYVIYNMTCHMKDVIWCHISSYVIWHKTPYNMWHMSYVIYHKTYDIWCHTSYVKLHMTYDITYDVIWYVICHKTWNMTSYFMFWHIWHIWHIHMMTRHMANGKLNMTYDTRWQMTDDNNKYWLTANWFRKVARVERGLGWGAQPSLK